MYEGIIQDLIDELGRLPGIGPKSAQRIAFHIVQSERVDVNRLVEVLRLVKEKVKFCSQCFNVAEEEECKICRDPRRDPSVSSTSEVSKTKRTHENPDDEVQLSGTELLMKELGAQVIGESDK